MDHVELDAMDATGADQLQQGLRADAHRTVVQQRKQTQAHPTGVGRRSGQQGRECSLGDFRFRSGGEDDSHPALLHREVDDLRRDDERTFDPGPIDGALEGLPDDRARGPIQMETGVRSHGFGLHRLVRSFGARGLRGDPEGSGRLSSRSGDRRGSSGSPGREGWSGGRGGDARSLGPGGAGECGISSELVEEGEEGEEDEKREQGKPENRNLMSHPDFLGPWLETA